MNTPTNDSPTLSHDTKVLITVLLLIFVYPAGLVMLFVWDIGPSWLRILLILPLLLMIIFFVTMISRMMWMPYY